MKTFVSLLATAVFCTWSVCAAAAPVVGQAAPVFTGTDAAGKKVSLADFKGKTVVLEWTSPECPFVKKHYESNNMQKLQKEAADKNVVWLSIDSSAAGKPGYMDGPAATGWLATQKAVPAHFLIDASGEIGRLYEAKTTPHMFVIDKNGTLAYAGAIDSIASANAADTEKAQNYVRDALTALEARNAVAVSATQSYGCGVKYAN